jgi:hypothetical protein
MPDFDSPLTDKYIADVVRLVDKHKAAHGDSDSTMSRLFVGGQDFIKRLRTGANVQIAKVRQLEHHIREASRR